MRILYVSDSPLLATGLGTVGRQVLRLLRFRHGHEIVVVGRGQEQQTEYDRCEHPYDIVPAGSGALGENSLPRILESFRPHVLLTHGDPWEFEWVPEVISRRPTAWIPYVTIDSRPLPPQCAKTLATADAIATCAHFGEEVIRTAIPDARVRTIYYGVDRSSFFPLDNRTELREAEGLADRFVVGFVGRNHPRKQIPLLIKAFSEFAAEEPSAFLYLHTDPSDIGWDIGRLLRRFDVGDRAGVTDGLRWREGLPPCRLNEIYNLFDVLVIPSMGEGFGLPIVEAMAAGAPVLGTDYSACGELVRGRGEVIGVDQFLFGTRLNLELALIDCGDLARKLKKLAESPAVREKMAAKGRSFAEELSWERTADGLAQVVSETVSEKHMLRIAAQR